MESRMEEYLNAAISGNTENLPKPISRIDFLLCELIKTLGESGASIEEVEKIVTDKVAEIVADAPEDFDTLKELSDWIYTHEESAAAMNTAIQTNTNSIESLMTDVNKKANSDDVYDKATADSRFLGIDATADKAVADENGSNISETFSDVKNDIAINRTTLGTQCKNLFDWKNAAYSTSLRLTQTKTESGISVTSTGSWAVTAYKLPVLEVGTNYIFSTTISNFSVQGGNANIIISTSTSSSNIVKVAKITSNGTVTIKFEATSDTMYVLFFPNYSDTVYTNSFTASDIMLRYADITDDTYEPYKESVDERLIQNKSDIAVNKSTLGTQCKNLLPFPKSISKDGITFTCDENGYMTASNTTSDARQWAAYNSQYNVKLKPGKYILSFASASVCTNAYGNIKVLSANDKQIVDIGQTNYYNKTSGAVEFTIDTEQTVYIMSKIFDGKTAIMLRYADIADNTYEPYQPSLYEQIAALEARIAALEV